MRGPVERFMRRLWAGEAGVVGHFAAVLLAPLSWAWGAVTALRNAYWERHGGHGVEGPTVISVGNLAAGGTGKTPFTAWLARELAEDAKPAVLLRGYGGDEGLLHAAWNPSVPVAEGTDRLRLAAGQAAEGRDVVLLDDGFQHRRLRRDLDVVLVAASDPHPQRLMPWGPYRERDAALRRAHVAIVTRGTEPLDACRAVEARIARAAPRLVTACVTFRPIGFTSLVGGEAVSPSGRVTVVTGVARPDAVRRAVESLTGETPALIGHGDHHRFRGADLEKARRSADALVVTEKDAVKLRALDGRMDDVFVLSREMVWEWGRDVVLARIREAMEGRAA